MIRLTQPISETAKAKIVTTAITNQKDGFAPEPQIGQHAFSTYRDSLQ